LTCRRSSRTSRFIHGPSRQRNRRLLTSPRSGTRRGTASSYDVFVTSRLNRGRWRRPDSPDLRRPPLEAPGPLQTPAPCCGCVASRAHPEPERCSTIPTASGVDECGPSHHTTLICRERGEGCGTTFQRAVRSAGPECTCMTSSFSGFPIRGAVVAHRTRAPYGSSRYKGGISSALRPAPPLSCVGVLNARARRRCVLRREPPLARWRCGGRCTHSGSGPRWYPLLPRLPPADHPSARRR